MKKSMSTSLIVHGSLLCLLIAHQPTPELTPEAPKPKVTAVDLQEHQPPQYIKIKELGTAGDSKENSKFYWGLGITTREMNSGDLITEVNSGYNGEAAGLMVGDFIIHVNGKPKNQNEIRGNGPAKLVLTILRNNSIITINTERGKVYY